MDKKWTKWTSGFPTVSVKDLVIQPREHDLVIGTFGRAAWVLDDIRPLRALAKDQSILTKKLQLFDPPTAYQAAYQQPTGSRFGGDALFNGQNRSAGAHISYFVTVTPKETSQKENEDKDEENEKEENKVQWDSIQLKIYDGDRLIRTLKQKTPDSTGIHKMRWFMDEKGVEQPSRKIQKSKREPGGVGVKPGMYKIVMEYGDQKSKTNIEVKSDPRLQVSQKNINETYTASKKLETMQKTAAEAVKQLVESKEVASKYQKELQKLDKKKFKEHIKSSKEIIKKIDSVVAIYIGKEDKRQGITRNPEVTVMQRLRTAQWYSASRQQGLTTTETSLIKQAKDVLKEALTKTNTFFNENWKPYKTSIEKLETSPFKEIKTFTIN